MFDLLLTPTFSTPLGLLAVATVIGLNTVLAFLAFFAYRLNARAWPVVALSVAAYMTLNLLIPHPTIRQFQSDQAFLPGDVLRLLLLLVCVTTGFHTLWVYIRDRGQK